VIVNIAGARLAAAAMVGLIVSVAAAFGAAKPFELAFRDAALRFLPEKAATRVIVVAIDERSLEREGAWPWPRERLAALLDGAVAAGAAAVAVDILLADPRPGDEVLAAALDKADSLVAAALDGKGEWVLPAPELLRSSTPAHASFELDRDGVLRRFAATKQSGTLVLTALPFHLASKVSGLPVPVGQTLAPAFRVAPRGIPFVSATDLLQGNPGASLPLQGKLVLIGPTALAIGDRVVTVRSHDMADPGVMVHAAAVEAILADDLVRSLSPFASGVIAAFLLWIAAPLKRLSAGRRIGAGVALVAAPVIAIFALAPLNATIPGVTMGLAFGAVVVGREAIQLLAIVRQGRSAAATMEDDLGVRGKDVADADLGAELEQLACAVARRHVEEIEGKRVLTHELQTPVAAIRNLSEVLTGFELSEQERARVVSLIGGEAARLEAMVGGLLELERLALRDFETSTRDIDIGDVVSRRIQLLGRTSDRRIESDISGGILIRADEALLGHVIDNLVGNAIKYSPYPCPVHVSLQDHDGAAVLEVADRGRGVPEGERTRIFNRFSRGAAARGTEGLGLGLSLVMEVVRWHGGTVVIADRPGGGAVFRVSFPSTSAREHAEAV
jgi:signal transduction histidine kinase